MQHKNKYRQTNAENYDTVFRFWLPTIVVYSRCVCFALTKIKPVLNRFIPDAFKICIQILQLLLGHF